MPAPTADGVQQKPPYCSKLCSNVNSIRSSLNRAPQGNHVYLRLEGAKVQNIAIAANDLRASE